jgi:hypothetical protein
MTTTTQLALTHLVEGQASAEVTINDSINKIDALIQLSVKDRDLTAPPGSPAEGDRYIPKATATGAWASKENSIAVYLSGWIFVTPREGFRAWIEDENRWVTYTGTVWVYRTAAEITASATQTQAGGTLVTTEVVLIGTVATANDAVTLPAALAGDHVLLYNNSGTAAQLWPASGETIDGLGVDASRTVGGNQAYDLWCVKDGLWAFG